MINLKKGDRINLAKDTVALDYIILGINWGKIISSSLFGLIKKTEAVDLDASVVLFDENGKNIDIVYFNKLKSKCKAIRHSGDDLHGDDEEDSIDNEQIFLKLNQINPEVTKIALLLTSYNKQTFDDLPYASVKITNKSNKVSEELANFHLTKDETLKGKCSIILAFLEKNTNNGQWTFIADGTGYKAHQIEQVVDIIKK